MSKLELSEQEHHQWWKEAGGWQLRQILYWRWDPIGVSDSFPSARDEYDGYAGVVCNLLRGGADAKAVAEYLAGIQAERMELPPGESEAAEIHRTAELLIRWYPASIRAWRARDGSVTSAQGTGPGHK